MATRATRARRTTRANTRLPPSARTKAPPEGMALTTEAKMSSDMPLPTPRWVMSSPIHMMRAVPAVSDSTTSITRGTVNSGIRSMALLPNSPPPPLWNRKASPVDCNRARATVR